MILNKIYSLLMNYHLTKQNLLLADELSPDGMRLWKDGESFDKDLFRKDKGDISSAYKYILEQLKTAIETHSQ